MTTSFSPRRPGVLLALFLLPLAGTATDWNQWRGPNRDGIAAGFTSPTSWSPDALVRKWSVAVGEGHSSPVVVGDRVYVFARDGEREVLRCLALTDGSVIWQEGYAAPYEMHPSARGHGKGPKATPTVVDGRVFTLGINGHVSAFDAKTGTVLWRKDFAGEYPATSPAFGAAASPLVHGKLVIVPIGGRNRGALAAFDVATGAVAWTWAEDGPGYTSPILATLGGVPQVITQSQKHCVAVSPTDGRELWRLPFMTPYEQNSVTPVVAGDLVIFGGIQKPTFAVKVTGAKAETVWENLSATMYMSTPVLSGTTLYGMSNKQRGSLFALEVKSGELLWQSEGRLGENASLTDIGPALLVLTDQGELTVQEKSATGLTERAKFKVAESPVWASLAVTGDRLLVKDKTNLTSFQVGRGN
jgi:outer membrane protein assembly factor BamB